MPTTSSNRRKLLELVKVNAEITFNGQRLRGQIVEVENEDPNSTVSVFVFDEDGNVEENKLWCLLEDETNPIAVYAPNIQPRKDAPVWVIDKGDGYEVEAVQMKEGTTFYGDGLGSVGTAVVYNEIWPFSLLARNYRPGQVIKSSQGGLWVFVFSFRYVRKDGSIATSPDAELDLTPYVPATSGMWSWVIVCVDPVTNTLTAVQGDEYAAPALLTADLLDDIDTYGLVPVDALKLENGQTEITGESEFTFGRALMQHHPRHNFEATTAPTTGDDETLGYEVGSQWIDTATGTFYTCSDASTGAAAWSSGGTPTLYYQTVAENGTPETQRGTLDFVDGVGTTPVATDNGGGGSTELQVDLDIDGLAADGSPDGSTDYVATWDASAGTHKKVLLENLPVSGSVITWTGSYWSPDAAPASPSAEDDEFADNSGGLPGGWTEMDFDANTTVNEGSSGLLLTQTTNAGNSVAGIYKALPSGDFTIWTRVALFVVDTAGGQAFRAGLTLYEDATSSTADIAQLTLQYDPGNTGPIPGRALHTAYNAVPTALGTQVATIPGSKLTDSIYIRIRRNGTNYTTDISLSGVGWGRYNTFTLGFTPAHMGLSVNNLATGETCAALFSFFRYVGSDVGNLGIMNGRRITYYGV